MSEELTQGKERVDEFLATTVRNKEEQLMGITLDLEYFAGLVGDTDVDVLRDELSTEQANVVKNKDRIMSDNRDMEKIGELNKRIDEVTKAQGEIVRLNEMKTGIEMYLSFIISPSDEIQATLLKFAGE